MSESSRNPPFRSIEPSFRIEPSRDGGFVFVHQLKMEAVKCAEMQKFVLYRNSGMAGELTVGRCTDGDAEKLNRMAHAAPEPPLHAVAKRSGALSARLFSAIRGAAPPPSRQRPR